jgi:phage-related baseplate assembly protein
MFNMPLAPNFVSLDLAAIQSEIVADYQSRTGRTLYPAQVENILLQVVAYRELLIRNKIQGAATENLVSFSTAPVLDYLGELVGVTRLGATAASCTIRFTLVTGHGGVVIPAGTRVSSIDGRAVFLTQSATAVSSGTNTVSVVCVCTAVGTAGNGYTAGLISTILDPQAFLSSAANTNTTAGGAESEGDTALRERIKLAPASFSNAGSAGAYKFHALGANPAIVDVAVTSPTPGAVYLYPLMQDGSPTPTQILNAVFAACNADRIRPLTDTVVVQTPTRINYSLQADLTLYDYADASVIVTAVQAALQAFVDERRTQLGKDVVDTQIIRICQIEGVYSVALTGFTNIIVSPTEFPFCNAINVQVVGTTVG